MGSQILALSFAGSAGGVAVESFSSLWEIKTVGLSGGLSGITGGKYYE